MEGSLRGPLRPARSTLAARTWARRAFTFAALAVLVVVLSGCTLTLNTTIRIGWADVAVRTYYRYLNNRVPSTITLSCNGYYQIQNAPDGTAAFSGVPVDTRCVVTARSDYGSRSQVHYFGNDSSYVVAIDFAQ